MAMLLRLCPKKVRNIGVIEGHEMFRCCLGEKATTAVAGYSDFCRRRSRAEVSQRPPPMAWISR